MTHSMTAFARREENTQSGNLVWEIRSVNHRFLEVSVRLPEALRSLDPLVRRKVAGAVSRGKVDCNLRYEPSAAGDNTLTVNEQLAKQLLGAAERVEQLMHEAVPLRTIDILGWPGVLESGAPNTSDLADRAARLLDQSLAELRTSRASEGQRLADLIRERCEALSELVAAARSRMPQVLDEIRQRLRNRLAEVTSELDPNRLEQELALLAQRLDTDEEMDRLGSHLKEVESALKRKEPVGRRLDFLMQELNREANTLGSKSSDLEITRISVEMKVLIEQMREQVQNCE